jgi:hypothetical protein
MRDLNPPPTPSVSNREGETALKVNTGQKPLGQPLLQSEMLTRDLEEQNTAKIMDSTWGWWEGNRFVAFPTAYSDMEPENRDPVTFELSESPYGVQDEAAFLQNYFCCDLFIDSFHSLLEHFEATHTSNNAVGPTLPYSSFRYLHFMLVRLLEQVDLCNVVGNILICFKPVSIRQPITVCRFVTQGSPFDNYQPCLVNFLYSSNPQCK